EAASNRAFIESRARLEPASGACWMSVAGATALFDGPHSPLTQTFGLGLFAEPRADDFAALEDFFTERAAPVFHEVSPIAEPSVLDTLPRRGYHPIELTTIMYRPIETGLSLAPRDTTATARMVSAHERDLWSDVAVEGWSEYPDLAPFMRDVARVRVHQDQG